MLKAVLGVWSRVSMTRGLNLTGVEALQVSRTAIRAGR